VLNGHHLSLGYRVRGERGQGHAGLALQIGLLGLSHGLEQCRLDVQDVQLGRALVGRAGRQRPATLL
jgi:hypothetical protein